MARKQISVVKCVYFVKIRYDKSDRFDDDLGMHFIGSI